MYGGWLPDNFPKTNFVPEHPSSTLSRLLKEAALEHNLNYKIDPPVYTVISRVYPFLQEGFKNNLDIIKRAHNLTDEDILDAIGAFLEENVPFDDVEDEELAKILNDNYWPYFKRYFDKYDLDDLGYQVERALRSTNRGWALKSEPAGERLVDRLQKAYYDHLAKNTLETRYKLLALFPPALAGTPRRGLSFLKDKWHLHPEIRHRQGVTKRPGRVLTDTQRKIAKITDYLPASSRVLGNVSKHERLNKFLSRIHGYDRYFASDRATAIQQLKDLARNPSFDINADSVMRVLQAIMGSDDDDDE